MNLWSIARVDTDPWTGKVTYFEVCAATRKRDLDWDYARQSGFVGPDDKLVVIGPDGKKRGNYVI